jgi:4-amino-4-deoxy-L-arabinose transferase-like glycosyltransferase
MLARADWVVPMFNAELRTHKPILLYWTQMISYQMVGANAWGARLPSAVLMIGTVLCTMLLSTRLLTHRFLTGRVTDHPTWSLVQSPSVWSGIVLASSLMVVVAGRAATPDSPLIFCSTLAVTMFAFGLTTRRDQVTQGNLFFLLAYTALGLGVLAKGPVGLVLPLTVVSAWFFIEKTAELYRSTTSSPNRDQKKEPSGKSSFYQRHLISVMQIARMLLSHAHPRSVWDYLVSMRLPVGLLLVLSIALPWYIWVGVRTEGRWLREFFWDHNVQRAMQSLEGHRGGIFYYPIASLVGLFPWSMWLAPFLYWFWKSKLWSWNESTLNIAAGDSTDRSAETDRSAYPSACAQSLTRFSLIWMAIYIGAFSCAKTKLPSYITPCYPGIALLVGLFLSQLSSLPLAIWARGRLQEASSLGLKRAMYATVILTMLIGIGATCGLAWVARTEGMWSVQWHSLWSLGLLFGPLGGWIALRRGNPSQAPAWFAAGAIVCIAGWMGGGASAVSTYRSDLKTLMARQEAIPETRWVAVGVLEPSWVFYTGHPIRELFVGSDSDKAIESSAPNWLAACRAHLLQHPASGVIALSSYADAIEKDWSERNLSTGEVTPGDYRLVRQEVPYFLRHQNLVLLTLERRVENGAYTAEQRSDPSASSKR